MISFIYTSVCIALSVFVQAAPQQQQPRQSQQELPTIYQIIRNIATDPATSNVLNITYNQLRQVPQLRDIVAGNSSLMLNQIQANRSITFFAPINQAWLDIPYPIRNVLGETNTTEIPQFPVVIDRRILNSFQQNKLLLSYHTVNQSINLNSTSEFVNRNTSVPTLLQPLNATIWRRQAQLQEQSDVQYDVPAVNQASQANVVSVPNAMYYNDANITAGYQASNGYVYLIDAVTSPLWFVNVSLSEIPDVPLRVVPLLP